MDRARKVVFEYLSKAEQCARSGLHASIMVHVGAPSFSSKKLPFILVNETTKQRYTSLVMPFFCMLFKVFENRAELQALKLSDNIRRATRDLYQSLKLRSCVTPFSELHAVLFEALLGNITLEESNSFTYAYLSCICVDAIDSENPRFRLGIEVSPYVSALVYLASCAGLFVLV